MVHTMRVYLSFVFSSTSMQTRHIFTMCLLLLCLYTIILGDDIMITFIDDLNTTTGEIIYKKPTEGLSLHLEVHAPVICL